MLHDLSPAFVVVNYHSPYGVHKQTIPTKAHVPTGGTHVQGGYANWNGGDVDADDMIKALVNAEADMMPNSVIFDQYTIYTKADASSPALPVQGNSLAITGSSALSGWYAAVQHSFNFLDNSFLAVKLVLLDIQSGGDFGKVLPAAFTTEQIALGALFVDPENAWSSRGGNRPNLFRNVTKTLNEKLRKEYHIT